MGTEHDPLLLRYAEVVLGVGLRLRPGQVLAVTAELEHAPLVRAVAATAYRLGARHVDVVYRDDRLRRETAIGAPAEDLAYAPAWMEDRVRHVIEADGAFLRLVSAPEPGVFAGVDPARLAGVAPRLPSMKRVSLENLVPWAVVGCPTAGWAQEVFGAPDLDRLWQAVAHCVRLDEDDPVAAWEAHASRLAERKQALDERRFRELRFRGPGTDLTVGLLDGAVWVGVESETPRGHRFIANLPTEEVFTTPDRRRTEGSVRVTRPLVLRGTEVLDLELRFAAGRIVDVRASAGVDAVRADLATDEHAPFLGEVALVDGGSRVGETGLVYHDTLFDENAASHIAWGSGYVDALPELHGRPGEERRARGVNDSLTHVDVMVGGLEVEVDGVARDGVPVPLLRDDAWQL